jgi:hypothetical protein
LKAYECSSLNAIKNLSRIVTFCGFQNPCNFSVFVTISIHSWLLFNLIACWLAIGEEISLRSIILIFLNQISWISFSQVKLSNQVQRCMNWKDIDFQASKEYQNLSSRGYDPMWIIHISYVILSPQGSLSLFQNQSLFFKFLVCLSCQNQSIRFCKPDYLVLDIGLV